MANTARTRPQRPSPATSSGRFGRGAPTRQARPTRPGRPARPTPRKSGGTQRRGVAGGWLQRSQPKPKGIKGALSGLGRSKPRSAGKSKRGGAAGGMALAAGAAGLAFKNRDKLTSLVRGKRGDNSGQTDGTLTYGTTPATPPVGSADTTSSRSDFDAGPDAPPKL